MTKHRSYIRNKDNTRTTHRSYTRNKDNTKTKHRSYTHNKDNTGQNIDLTHITKTTQDKT